MALQTTCQSLGIRSTAGCPLSLNMHGSCGGAKLQVRFSKAELVQAAAWRKACSPAGQLVTVLACDCGSQ
jgi:hypothetical protein